VTQAADRLVAQPSGPAVDSRGGKPPVWRNAYPRVRIALSAGEGNSDEQIILFPFNWPYANRRRVGYVPRRQRNHHLSGDGLFYETAVINGIEAQPVAPRRC